MRLFSVLFVLATTTTTVLSNPPEPLTLLSPEQDVRLNNIVWLYSQFSLTFDGDPTMYKCKMDVPTRPLIHEDSCSYYLNTGAPSILAVPYWGLCKLFG